MITCTVPLFNLLEIHDERKELALLCWCSSTPFWMTLCGPVAVSNLAYIVIAISVSGSEPYSVISHHAYSYTLL